MSIRISKLLSNLSAPLAVLLFAHLAQTQNLKFDHLTMADGLSNNDVYCILQDSRGFMWLGTNDGLNKYDGYQFTVYKNKANDPGSISGSEVLAILEDSNHDIWIGTERGGLNRYDRQLDQFTQYLPDTTMENKSAAAIVHAIREDSRGWLWVGTGNGLYLFDKATRAFSNYFHNSRDSASLSNDNVFSITEDSKNRLWVGTSNGLNLFNYGTGKFVRYFSVPNITIDQGDNEVRSIYEDIRGNLWIGTYFGGLIRFNPETNTYKRYLYDNTKKNSLSNNSVFCITSDGAENLYIGTENGGLNVFNFKTEEFRHYFLEVNDKTSISSNSIYSVFFSDDDILWVGTFNGGLNFSSGQTRRFHHYEAGQGGLNNPYVLSLCEDRDDNLWIGTDGGGLNFLNRKTGQFKYFTHDENNPNSISANAVTSVFEDSHGLIWVGTYRGGLDLFNPKTEIFIHFQNDPKDKSTIQHNYVQMIFEDSRGDLYVGVFTGLDLFDRTTKKFSRCRFINTGVLSMIEDKDSNFWIGSYSGMNYVNKTTGAVKSYIYNFSDPGSTIPSVIRALFEDSRGHLWIGTTEGLYNFDKETQKFIRYTIRDVQPDIYIHNIVEDDNGNLWVGSTQSIYKLVDAIHLPENPVFVDLGVHDGIKCLFKSRSGEMFFGGDYGLNVFLPSDIVMNPHVPPVVFTNFKVFNKDIGIGKLESQLRKHITETRGIALSHNQSVITFEFAALNYILPEKNQYAFMMEGFDKDWNYVGNKRSATYTNLNPGEYIFKIKGSNNDDVWNEAGAAIALKIIPPWWKTWWAYMLYVLISVFLLYAVRRFQINKEHIKHELALEHLHSEKLEEINRMKSRFFSNITHEFRMPLTLIMGPVKQMLDNDISEHLKEQCQVILRNSKKLYQLINQLLDLSKLEAGHMALQTKKVNIINILEKHITYFVGLAELKKIRLHFSVKSETHIGKKLIDVYLDEDKFEKIIYNLLSNAVKFTPDSGEIDVCIKEVYPSKNHIEINRKEKISAPWNIRNKFGKKTANRKSALTENAVQVKHGTPGYVEIAVKDTGIGIPAECLGEIFNRFYQVDQSHTRKYEGSGIGLALTRELVELHSGAITVESQYGQGSTFYVRLPLGKDHLKPDEIVEKAALVESQSDLDFAMTEEIIDNHNHKTTLKKAKRKKAPLIVIVEDNDDLRKYLRRCLNQDYLIIEARDGQEGLVKAKEQIPDLVISDVMMPGMDGLELCARLKTDEATSHIPVILLTARTSGESKIEGLETGADDYIIKPFEVKELQVRMHNLIEQRRQLRLRYNGKTGLKPKEIAITSADEKFLEKALLVLEQNLSDPDFSTDEFSREMALSRVQLYRKIRALTGQSTSEFIRVFRLNRATQLLKQRFGTISQIAYSVGFNSPSYFYRSFNKHFGIPPSNYTETE